MTTYIFVQICVNMKRHLANLFLLLCISFSAVAQGKFAPLDKSPMDASYYPVNYPILRIQDKASEPLMARVIYSRPQRSGRNVFGELVEYGKVWRLGANEATEIEFYRDVKVNGNKVKKGRYTMYCIPATDKWTIILNKDTDIWGAFKYDIKKDVLRTTIPVQKQPDALEALTIMFEKTNAGIDLVMSWDTVVARLPISV
jgi:hypothetical protein